MIDGIPNRPKPIFTKRTLLMNGCEIQITHKSLMKHHYWISVRASPHLQILWISLLFLAKDIMKTHRFRIKQIANGLSSTSIFYCLTYQSFLGVNRTSPSQRQGGHESKPSVGFDPRTVLNWAVFKTNTGIMFGIIWYFYGYNWLIISLYSDGWIASGWWL